MNIVIGAVTTSGERQGSSYMLFKPYGVAAYTGGAMVVGEYNNSVVKYTINGQTAQMTAGTGKKGNLPKGNASIDATSAQLNAPSGITVFNTSLSSIYYVSDTGNNRVCKVVNGQLSTVAGGVLYAACLETKAPRARTPRRRVCTHPSASSTLKT